MNMMHQRRSHFLSSILFLVVLLFSRHIAPTVTADDANAATTTSMHRDATDSTVTDAIAPGQQRRELFWSLTFLSKSVLVDFCLLLFIGKHVLFVPSITHNPVIPSHFIFHSGPFERSSMSTNRTTA